MNRFVLYCILINLLAGHSFLAQNSGLLKNEKITTYWNVEKNQVRSEGVYQTNGYSKIGAKAGQWKHYYKNGNIQELRNYYKGELNGEFRSYYLNGNLNIKAFYTVGKLDSIFEAYYVNGNLAEKGSYDIYPSISYKDTLILDYWIDKNEKIISRKIGDWKYFYEDYKMMEKTHFIVGDSTEYIDEFYDINGDTLISDGKGLRRDFYPSKKIKSTIEYKNGIENGTYKFFKPNGEIRKSGIYINGKKSGKWEELFITTDSIYQIVEYKDGKKTGGFKEYYQNGKISMNGHYKDDLKNGLWTYNFRNGSLDMEGQFKDDQQDGFWTFYYPKGIEYYKGYFVNGQKDGNWEFFYNNSTLWKKGEYKFDLKNGYWITKFENGDTAMAGEYKMDKENGLWKSWYENGQLKDIGFFNAGKMDQKWEGYYKNGQLKYSGEYNNDYKVNSWIYWSEKGKIIERRSYKVIVNKSKLVPNENRLVKKSVADGKWIKYSEYDESLKSEENYVDGKLNGTSIYYYPGGVISNREVNYKNGLLDGSYKNFSRKGKIISETNYKNNKKDGDVKLYSKRGKLISHLIYKNGLKIKDVLKKISYDYNSPNRQK